MQRIKKGYQSRIVKKFTLFPLRIYQYTSQTTWWSWMEVAYIMQCWHYASEGLDSANPITILKAYFFWRVLGK